MLIFFNQVASIFPKALFPSSVFPMKTQKHKKKSGTPVQCVFVWLFTYFHLVDYIIVLALLLAKNLIGTFLHP